MQEKVRLRNMPKDELLKRLNRLKAKGGPAFNFGDCRKAKYIKYQLRTRFGI